MQSDLFGPVGSMPSLTSGHQRPALQRGRATAALMPSDSEPIDPNALREVRMLSPREHQVLQELVDGKSHEAAAADLFISHHTFRTHVKNILTKFGAHSSIEAVSIAVCAGMRPTRMAQWAEPDGRRSGDVDDTHPA